MEFVYEFAGNHWHLFAVSMTRDDIEACVCQSNACLGPIHDGKRFLQGKDACCSCRRLSRYRGQDQPDASSISSSLDCEAGSGCSLMQGT